MFLSLFHWLKSGGKRKSLEIFGPGFTFCMKIALLVILYLKIDWNRLSLLFSSTPQPRGREMRSALCSQFFSWLYFCLTLILSLCVYKLGTLLAERNWAILIMTLRNTTVSQYIQYSCLAHHMEWPSLGIKEEEKGKDWNEEKGWWLSYLQRHILEVSRSTKGWRQTADKNHLSK